MKVLKRNGKFEKTDFSKIQKRLEELSSGLNVDIAEISQKAIATLYDGVSTREVDEHLATIAVNHSVHPDYNKLAGRICSSSLHKETALNHFTRAHEERLGQLLKRRTEISPENPLIKKYKEALFEDDNKINLLESFIKGEVELTNKEIDSLVRVPRFYFSIKTMHREGVINDEVLKFVEDNREALENKISYKRDFLFDYFGFKTLERAYLLRKFYTEKEVQEVELKDEQDNLTGEIEKREVTVTKHHIIERPQDMFMRVSIGILRREDNALERIFELYDLMSNHYYTHATPTLFNSGTKREQLSSCFLINNAEDSIEGIFATFEEEALISKNSGGIGVAVSNIRSKGSIIKGTNGKSKGILPFLKIKNEVARGIDQGGKRKGSFAVYLEPWHADVEDFIRLRRNDGTEEERARDLFLALWVPSLFYKRVEEGKQWSLFDPASAPGLQDAYGEEFNKLYEQYEKEGRAVRVIDAREFMKDIFENQIETGTPYILNKDHCNEKSNQKNLGTIKSSNLCTEIIEYTDDKESAVCNLASICLPKFVTKDGKFDHDALHKVVRTATFNLNAVIDINYYVNDKTRNSNFRHRPIGLGVQGLADVFNMMRIAYTSEEAKKVNEEIFETIYHAALSESLDMAKKHGHYPSMKENGGAPITKGILQFDMWGHEPKSGRYNNSKKDKLSWVDLKEEIKKHGLRNSLLVAPMPTASTSQIFNNQESFEPMTENLYKRQTLSGEFLVANKHLIRHLEELELWSQEVRDYMVANNGSIQGLTFIPEEVREIYKTVWELKLKPQIEMAADRGAYICQSQSLNLHMEKPSMELMKNYYLVANKLGLKTASYYFKTTAAGKTQAVTLTSGKKQSIEQEDDDDCLVCGS